MPTETLPVLLAIETATDLCGVALVAGDRVLVSHAIGTPRSHAEWLATMIQDALRYGRIAANELAGVAVSRGPGSYTGLRIGVSAAKGLCFATGVPLVGVPTLEAAAHGVLPFACPGDRVAVALHSRRDEIYLATFFVEDGRLHPDMAPCAVLIAELPRLCPIPGRHILWALGEGAPALAACWSGTWGDQARFRPDVGPSAVGVARVGLERFRRGVIEPLDVFEPTYLKEFIPREKSGTAFDRLPGGGG